MSGTKLAVEEAEAAYEKASDKLTAAVWGLVGAVELVVEYRGLKGNGLLDQLSERLKLIYTATQARDAAAKVRADALHEDIKATYGGGL